MIYKLYKDKTKSETPEDPSFFNEFSKMYEENNVKVLGVWQNVSDTREFYFMTGYQDESHYNQFVEKMKENERYQELTREMSKERESIEVITLKDAF